MNKKRTPLKLERIGVVPASVLAKSRERTKKMTKGIIYYTDNKLDAVIMRACVMQLYDAADMVGDLPIIAISLLPLRHVPSFSNIVLPFYRGYLAMFKQILVGLEVSDADIIFFAEHDILYHPSHFDFVPERDDIIYYNTNVWKWRLEDGFAIRTDDCRQTSGLCAYRETLLRHYRQRVDSTVQMLANLGGNNRQYRKWIRSQGFEPGTHGRKERVDELKSERWESAVANIDIRHSNNLTPSRWEKEQYRNKRFTLGWQESNDGVPGWDDIKELIK
jgi:hypothetical protein